jgi:hypothetical protein
MSAAESWRELLAAAAEHGVHALPVSDEDLARLRTCVDLSTEAEEVLRLGWPVRPLPIGSVALCPDLLELTEAMQKAPAWPRHCLPLALPQPETVAWDLLDGTVPLLEPGQPLKRSPGYESLALLVEDALAWLQLVADEAILPVESRVGVPVAVFEALTLQMAPGWSSRWPFQRVVPLPELKATLQAELKLNQRTAFVCAVAVAMSPFLGWMLGHLVQQEWLGVGLALLVVGGVPSLLLMQAQGRAKRVETALKRWRGE